MKKVLLTSTALVAFAGAAAAEVTLSGWAEMGVVGGSSGQTTQFFQDVDVDFTLSGETDSGLVFGANVDLDEAGNLGDPFSNQGVDIFVSGEFGTVTLGDTDGALAWAVDDIAAWGDPGTIDDAETAHFGFTDTWLDESYDGQILRYDYTFDDFGFAVSLEQDDTNETPGGVETCAVVPGAVDGDPALTECTTSAGTKPDDYNWGVGAKWTPQMGPGTLALGIGYQTAQQGRLQWEFTESVGEALQNSGAENLDAETDGYIDFFRNADNDDAPTLSIAIGDSEVWSISAGYTMDNGFSGGLVYSDFTGDVDINYWGIGLGYAFDAFSIHANYGQFDTDGVDLSGYGVAMGYDMGGGLSVLAGYGQSEIDISTDTIDANESFDTWSLGLSMAF